MTSGTTRYSAALLLALGVVAGVNLVEFRSFDDDVPAFQAAMRPTEAAYLGHLVFASGPTVQRKFSVDVACGVGRVMGR